MNLRGASSPLVSTSPPWTPVVHWIYAAPPPPPALLARARGAERGCEVRGAGLSGMMPWLQMLANPERGRARRGRLERNRVASALAVIPQEVPARREGARAAERRCAGGNVLWANSPLMSTGPPWRSLAPWNFRRPVSDLLPLMSILPLVSTGAVDISGKTHQFAIDVHEKSPPWGLSLRAVIFAETKR